jgi:hypothetical protein
MKIPQWLCWAFYEYDYDVPSHTNLQCVYIPSTEDLEPEYDFVCVVQECHVVIAFLVHEKLLDNLPSINALALKRISRPASPCVCATVGGGGHWPSP